MTSLSTSAYIPLDSLPLQAMNKNNNTNSCSALLNTGHSSNPFASNLQEGLLSRPSEHVSGVNQPENAFGVSTSNYSPNPIETCLQEGLLSQRPEKVPDNIPRLEHHNKTVSISTGNSLVVAWSLKKVNVNSSRAHLG